MSELPRCRYCHQPYTLVRETPGSQGWYEFACEACKVGHVYSKPQATAAARYANRLQAELQRAEQIKRWEAAKKSYSFSPTRTPKEIT